MNIINKKMPFLVIAVILSLMLHIIVIAGISGIDLFNLKDFFTTTKPFYAKIISELSEKPALSKLINEPPPIQSDNTPQRQETSLPVEENATMTEQIASAEKQIHDDKNEIQHKDDKPLSDMYASEKSTVLPDTQNTIQLLKFAEEKLYFDIYWLGIYVGKAVLEATNNNGNVKIISSVHSAPFISAFYKVEDHAESHVINGIPSFFKIKQREGRKRGDKETVFDTTSKKIIHINHIKGTKDEHNINAEQLWDVMSGFYYLRTQKLNIGETVYINIFDSNKFYKAEVEVLKKDKVIMPNEKEINAIVVKPKLKSEGLFESKGDIYVWLSDDEIKIPLKVETDVPIGKVVAELKIIETKK